MSLTPNFGEHITLGWDCSGARYTLRMWSWEGILDHTNCCIWCFIRICNSLFLEMVPVLLLSGVYPVVTYSSEQTQFYLSLTLAGWEPTCCGKVGWKELGNGQGGLKSSLDSTINYCNGHLLYWCFFLKMGVICTLVVPSFLLNKGYQMLVLQRWYIWPALFVLD